MGRIVIAVVVGFALWTILWVAAGQVVVTLAPDAFPEDEASTATGLMLLFNAFSLVFSIVTGFVVAKIAQAAAMKAVWVLGIVLLVVGIAVETAGWGRTPVWYHLIFLLLLVPGVLIGGRLASGSKTE